MTAETVLGTVTEAAGTLGVDAADIWEMVARGELRAERLTDGPKWTIYRRARTARR